MKPCPKILQRSPSGLPIYGVIVGTEYNGVKKTLQLKEDGSAVVLVRKYAHGELEDFTIQVLSKEKVEAIKYQL